MGKTFKLRRGIISLTKKGVFSMDMQKIGAFLAELRKERKLTQEDLGEKIGVTNKTVSRWENGNYLPPVEILQLLSSFYNVSINEILSGKRLNDAQYKENAEKNIVTALNNSTASFNDKSRAYRKTWLKKHCFELAAEIFCLLSLLICGAVFDNKLLEFGCLCALIYSWWIDSRINEYVSKNIFKEKEKENNSL